MSSRGKKILLFVLAVGLLSAEAADSRACTTFCFKQGDRVIVGKSFDYRIGPGMAFINKRGVRKEALPVKPGDNPAKWVSRYGSVTFNQNGRELPLSGMNEKGLLIEVMWLKSARYPKPDRRFTINELQWLQYHLDTCADVKEMIASAPKVRLSAVYGKLHYLACDRTGACAAFEFLDGRLIITSGPELKVNTLANHTYAESAAFLSKHAGFGGALPVPKSTASLDRFVRASALALEKVDPTVDPIGRAFRILDAVSQGEYSKWNLVYDLTNLRVYFRTFGHDTIKFVDLKRFGLGCETPVRMLDMDVDFNGDVFARFRKYTAAGNLELVKKGFEPIKHRFPPPLLRGLAEFPGSLRCTTASYRAHRPGGKAKPPRRRPIKGWWRARMWILILAGVVLLFVVVALSMAGQVHRKHK